MKFCYNTNITLPKQSQRSSSVLQDGSRSFGLFWKEKNSCLITEEIRYFLMKTLCRYPSLEPSQLDGSNGGSTMENYL